MKICLTSDTHGLHDRVKIPPSDILIHAGDCTNDIGQASLREFLIWLNRQPAEHIVLIAGNHDGAFEKWPTMAQAMVKQIAPKVTYLQDSGCEIEGITIWGSPVQPSFCDWHFNRERGEAIRKHWDMIPSDTDILVTHGPAYGLLDVSGFKGMPGEQDGRCGCRDLKESIYRIKPSLHVFGHIHHSYGHMTLVHDDGCRTTEVNASSCNERYQPVNKPIIFDYESNRVID